MYLDIKFLAGKIQLLAEAASMLRQGVPTSQILNDITQGMERSTEEKELFKKFLGEALPTYLEPPSINGLMTEIYGEIAKIVQTGTYAQKIELEEFLDEVLIASSEQLPSMRFYCKCFYDEFRRQCPVIKSCFKDDEKAEEHPIKTVTFNENDEVIISANSKKDAINIMKEIHSLWSSFYEKHENFVYKQQENTIIISGDAVFKVVAELAVRKIANETLMSVELAKAIKKHMNGGKEETVVSTELPKKEDCASSPRLAPPSP